MENKVEEYLVDRIKKLEEENKKIKVETCKLANELIDKELKLKKATTDLETIKSFVKIEYEHDRYDSHIGTRYVGLYESNDPELFDKLLRAFEIKVEKED